MKLDTFLLWAGLVGLTASECGACKVTIPASSPASICSELSEAGCLLLGSDCTSSVATQLDAGGEPWLTCLSQGGNVVTCEVPCSTPE